MFRGDFLIMGIQFMAVIKKNLTLQETLMLELAQNLHLANVVDRSLTM